MKYAYFVSLIIIALLFTNCTNNDENLESLNSNTVDVTVNKLKEKDVEQVGLIHNQYLEQFFNDFDFKNENKLLELENNIVNSDMSEFSDSKLNIKSEIEINLMYDEKEYLNQYFPNTKDILKQAVDEINSESNLEDIQKKINHLQNDLASYPIDALDYNSSVVSLEVLKSSSEFWLPESRGGNGKGDYILNKIYYKNAAKKAIPCVGAVIMADGLTAGSGMIISAILVGSTTGPIGVGAFLGLVGLRAAIASGVAALGACTGN